MSDLTTLSDVDLARRVLARLADEDRASMPGGGYRQATTSARPQDPPGHGYRQATSSGYCRACRCIRSAAHLAEGTHR